jgi:hypothetical protein
MASESLGVILVLTLGGLVIPIAMLFVAALVEVIVAGWALLRLGHDALPPGLVRFLHGTRLAAPGAHPR